MVIYRPAIYRMARRRGMQHADAQDLVQAVLMRVAGAIQSWEKSGPETKFRHWLRRVARNAKTHFEEVGRPGPGWNLSIRWPREKPEKTWKITVLPMMEKYGKAAARIGDPYVEPDLNRLTLPNGYKVAFASRLQVSLVDSRGSGVAGARLEKIGCQGKIIYGLITQREGVDEPEDTLGYFWMDSATGEITKGMKLGAWSEKLREMGVNDPQMLNPEQVGPKF